MYMMGYYVNLFGDGFNDQVLRQDTPYRMAKAIGFVGTIPVKPNGAMCPHDDHAVDDDGYH
jgi:hypothetical protein